jgi:hypothetical protein
MNLFERCGLVFLAVALTQPVPISPATIIVSGPCTLPDAVEAANTDAPAGGCTAGSGADTVRLTDHVELTTSIPGVNSKIRVEGQGFTVSRDAVSTGRLFNVNGTGDLTLVNATLTGGDESGKGGAINNGGVLQVEDSFIVGNHAGDSGGGISNNGVATIVNSTISGNTAGDDGGGIYANFGADTTLIDSNLTSNYSFWEGSGMFSYEGGVTISGSTISDNQHSGLVVFYSGNDVAVVNSTISGNSNYGVWIEGGGGDVRFYNSTLAHNGGDNLYGYTYSADGAVFSNNIFGYSGGRDCDFSNFVDSGGNLDTDGTCSGAADLTGLDPLLADNGGPTETHALLAGSSAIDAGGDCGLLVDQRGFGRDAACDSGAFEFDGAPAIVSSVGGLTPQGARCGNLTAGGSVNILDATDWNCRSEGLSVDSGDRVRQTVRGRPSALAFTGTVAGISNVRVLCQNFLTGQSVQFALGGESTFDCREQGLDFSPDNLIGWTVTGTAD